LGWACQSFDPVICTDDTDEGFAKKTKPKHDGGKENQARQDYRADKLTWTLCMLSLQTLNEESGD
jgi:hypothetical protein